MIMIYYKGQLRLLDVEWIFIITIIKLILDYLTTSSDVYT